MFPAGMQNLRGCRWLRLPWRQSEGGAQRIERCMRCRGWWPRRVCHCGQMTPIGTWFRCCNSSRFVRPESSAYRMAQLVLGILFECRIRSSEPEIVKVDVSALDLTQRMNSIYAPKARAVIRRRIKDAVAVQHGLCSEPIDGPC